MLAINEWLIKILKTVETETRIEEIGRKNEFGTIATYLKRWIRLPCTEPMISKWMIFALCVDFISLFSDVYVFEWKSTHTQPYVLIGILD